MVFEIYCCSVGVLVFFGGLVSLHYALVAVFYKIWENFLSGIRFWTFLKMSIFKNSLNFFPKIIFTKILGIVFLSFS
jgi:hypothetical protein